VAREAYELLEVVVKDYRRQHEIACAALEVAKQRAEQEYSLAPKAILFKKIDKNGKVSVGYKDYDSDKPFRLIPKQEVISMGIDIYSLPEYTQFSQIHYDLQSKVNNFFYETRSVCKSVLYAAKVESTRRFYEERRQIYEDYLNSPEWSAKRQACYQIHGTNCADCNLNFATDIHHRHYETLGDENPESDIVPLCSDCHKARHDSGDLMDKVENRHVS
jgi:hypothetical protein